MSGCADNMLLVKLIKWTTAYLGGSKKSDFAHSNTTIWNGS